MKPIGPNPSLLECLFNRVYCPSSPTIDRRSTSILALVDARKRTTVEVFASGYDTRTSGNGCSPDGCMPENTRDNSRDANSRWSCQGDSLDDDDNNGCWLDYYFDEPQDIVRMRIAFHKGDENTRSLDVYEDGNYHSTITSSGSTLGYQNFLLDTDETNRIRLRLDDYSNNGDVWLSITEVR